MPFSIEFKELYGNNSGSVNRAVRAEIPSGNEVLDALEGLSTAVRYERGTRTGKILEELYKCLMDTRDTMRDLIKEKYWVPNPGDSKPTPHKTSPNWLNFTK